MPDAPALTPPFGALLFGLTGCLVDYGGCQAEQLNNEQTFQPQALCNRPAPGVLRVLEQIKSRQTRVGWIDQLTPDATRVLTSALPDWVQACGNQRTARPWPAPDSCWQALITLGVDDLQGCVLISGEPRLLQAGLNAGLWTIGLACGGSLCGLSEEQWRLLDERQREQRRGQATLQLFALGVHSVIDHLEALDGSLADIAQRRLKGEKP